MVWSRFSTAVMFLLASLGGTPATADAVAGSPPSVSQSDEYATGEAREYDDYQDEDDYDSRYDDRYEGEDFFGARPFRVTASSGVDFTTGDFGSSEDTDLLSVPFGLKLEWEPFILKVSSSYIRIDGDVVPVGGNPEPVPGLSGVRDGMGDVVLAGTYVYYPGKSVSFLPVTELTGKVKFGTANEDKGLGTGEIDYTVKLDLSKSFGRFTPFGAVGYTFLGEPPGVDLDDKLFAYGGFTMRVLDSLSVGVAYDWGQSSVAGRTDFHEISPFATIKFGKHFAIDPYFVAGLSQSSPDWGAGLQMRVIYDFKRD